MVLPLSLSLFLSLSLSLCLHSSTNSLFLSVLNTTSYNRYFTKCPQDEAGEYIKPSARTDAEDTSTRTSAPLCKAIANTFCYSMGIIAFGSFVIAVVQFIRAVLLYIQKQAESTNNRVMVCIARCLQCYMACVESCMKYITKNAYILHTIEGGGFCKNGINVITLLMSNMSLMRCVVLVLFACLNYGLPVINC